MISITGIGSDGSAITLTLNGTSAKTYPLTQTSLSTAAFQETTNGQGITCNQGNDDAAKVIISNINLVDSVIVGNFNFTGFRIIDGKKISITNGKINNVKIYKPVSNAGSNFFKCKINGTQFNGFLLVKLKHQGKLSIGGSAQAGIPSVSLSLDANIGTGESELGSFLFDNFGQYNESTSVLMGSEVGKVNIIKHDKSLELIEGTFEFDAKDQLSSKTAKITEGSFSINY